MPYSDLTSHLIDRSECNQRDGIGLPVEFGCSPLVSLLTGPQGAGEPIINRRTIQFLQSR
jgi:hypothetical protein